jgi:hypothetical protein
MKVRLFTEETPDDQGTIVLFGGEVIGGQYDGLNVRVAIDHRPAQTIAEALSQHTVVVVEPEPWQVLL